MKKSILLLLLILCSQLALSGQNTVEADIPDKDNLLKAEEYLNSNTSLAYLKTRQNYFDLQNKDLLKLSGVIKNDKTLAELSQLIEGIIKEKENESIFNFVEEIFVNNLPASWNLPFYEGQKHDISLLSAQGFGLFFNNLKLNYKSQKLLQVDASLWVNEKIANTGAVLKKQQEFKNIPKIISRENIRPVIQTWSYAVKTTKTDFLYNSNAERQYIKKYAEGPVSPKFFKGAVIFRDEDRAFCLDALTGEEIWSIAAGIKKEEFYQTLRHPHHNTSSYDILIEDDILFAVLGGKLVATNLKDILKPKKLWEINLGEYTSATAPVKYKNNIIIGLINERAELWVCSFDINDAVLKWSTYIGISSCFSPPCNLFRVVDDKVIIGTNHKVLICLDPLNGGIFWIKGYTSRKYDLFEFWLNDQYLGRYFDKAFIDFDTQFINNSDNAIYYKPRESNYLYVIGLDGKTLDELLMDPDKYYLLTALKDKFVFLEKKPESQTAKLCVLSTDNKKILDLDIEGGELQGVVPLNKNEIFFKTGKTIHYLDIFDVLSHRVFISDNNDWLVNANNESLITYNEGKLKCGIYAKKVDGNNNTVRGLLSLRKDIIEGLQKAVDSNTGPSGEIIDEINEQTVSLKGITDFFISNLDRVNKKAWNKTCKKLSETFKDEIITFKETEMRFTNFLIDSGFLESGTDKNIGFIRANGSTQVESLRPEPGDFMSHVLTINGTQIGLSPLKVIKGTAFPDIFLAINYDQLLGVNNKGSILWERKSFCNINFPEKELETYLYDNIIILNDKVNIIAIDKNSGQYLWSKTNHETNKKQYFTNTFASKYTIDFADDRAIVLHNATIFSINPYTGYTYKALNIENIREIKSDGKFVYSISDAANSIILRTMNKELETVEEVEIDSSEKLQNNDQVKFAFLNDYIAIYRNSKLYLIDKTTKNINISPLRSGQVFIDGFPGNILYAIEPYKQLIKYDAGRADCLVWAYSLDKGKKIVNSDLGNCPYYIEKDRTLLPYYEDNKYYLISVNNDTGKELWRKLLGHTSGNYIHFSNFIEINKDIYFMVSSACNESVDQDKYPLFNVITRLYAADSDTGAIKLVNEFPFMGNYTGTQRNILLCTDKLLVATTNGNIIKIFKR
ncbi:MAG: PQQ-like beta-propeller repeat protein [Elusimicrobia bacterium]|nr:PQQ-like beta-propeller repeat protein [Candidatus Liberimonas magnetica]